MYNKKRTIKKASFLSIKILLDEAINCFDSSPQLSERYVKMAFDLLKKNKIRLPKNMKVFCKKCLNLWVPGKTCVFIFDSKNLCFRVKCFCGFSKRL